MEFINVANSSKSVKELLVESTFGANPTLTRKGAVDGEGFHIRVNRSFKAHVTEKGYNFAYSVRNNKPVIAFGDNPKLTMTLNSSANTKVKNLTELLDALYPTFEHTAVVDGEEVTTAYTGPTNKYKLMFIEEGEGYFLFEIQPLPPVEEVEMSEEQRLASTERLAAARAARLSENQEVSNNVEIVEEVDNNVTEEPVI